MLLPARRRLASLSALALLLVAPPATAQRYDSMSAPERQRRLERYTDDMINTLRNQRNSPSRRVSAGPDPWVEQMRARDAQRKADAEARLEQARMDAAWRREHPNESRAQYFERIEREAANEARQKSRQRQDAIRAQRARVQAEEAADWARTRASYHGYAAEVRPPSFTTISESLQWYLSHATATQNEWAANQAAMLLIEGVGVARRPGDAARLLDPNGRIAQKAGRRHSESRALWAYLQLVEPATLQAEGFTVDAAAARAELEEVARTTPMAQWYLARVLNLSPSPEDQKRALRLIAPGSRWARSRFGSGVIDTPAGRGPLTAHVRDCTMAVVMRQRVHLRALIHELPLPEFEEFADLVPFAPQPLRTEGMAMYVEAIAERIVPLTPSQEFNYSAYDSILEKAGEAGIDGVDGLGALRRFHLLGIDELGSFKPGWGLGRVHDRTLAALTRWGARDDVLGARARLAIQALAFEAGSSPTWTLPRLPEVAQYQAAAAELERLEALAWIPADSPKPLSDLRSDARTARDRARPPALAAILRRDSAAPAVAAIPSLLAGIKVNEQWQSERAQLDALASGRPIDPSTFAVEDGSVDVTAAAAAFDRAFALGAPRDVRRHQLFEAMRLGDAFAPAVLAVELETTTQPQLAKLRELSAARRARDVAARRPRALLLQAIDARLHQQEFESLLQQAEAAGSVVAARLRTAHQIEKLSATEDDRPPSWNLSPATIAELDASIATWDSDAFSTEWDFVDHVLSLDASSEVRTWFYPAGLWAADRAQRELDAELVRAVQPQLDAILATLATWPGVNQDDPRYAELRSEAAALSSAGDELAPSDGLGSIKLFLRAAALGNRGALESLAAHIRLGVGELPRSAELADAFAATELKMMEADAEIGDAVAAEHLAGHFLRGRDGPRDVGVGEAWLRYAAERGARTAAIALRDRTNLPPSDPAAKRRWVALVEAIEYREFLPTAPRRLASELISIVPLRASLESSLAAGQRVTKNAPLTEAQRETLSLQFSDAEGSFPQDPAAGLVALAKISAAGSREASFVVAQVLASGAHGLEPDRGLAQQFHALGREQLQAEAEHGDAHAAYRLGLYVIDLPLTRADSAAAVRWLSYGAELGESTAAEALAALYTDGGPGLSPDEAAAARWRAFATATTRDDFKPRSPLRK